jgi:hypothetical protein
VIAIAKGEQGAAITVVESFDRFLQRTGRLQRYATYLEMRHPEPPRLYPVDPEVPDFLRVQFGAPTLAQARKREAELMRKAHKTKVVVPS